MQKFAAYSFVRESLAVFFPDGFQSYVDYCFILINSVGLK